MVCSAVVLGGRSGNQGQMEMGKRELFTLALVTLTLAAPTSIAESISGSFEAPSATLSPPLSLSATDPLVALSEIITTSAVRARGDSVTLEYRWIDTIYINGVPGVVDLQQERSRDERWTQATNATLTFSDLGQDAFIAAFVLPAAEGDFSLELESRHETRLVGAESKVISSNDQWTDESLGEMPYAFSYSITSAHVQLRPEEGLGRVAGDFSLYIWDSTLSVTGDQGPESYRTGITFSNQTPASRDAKEAWLIAHFTNGLLEFEASDSDANIYTDSLVVTGLAGFHADDATGSIRSGQRAFEAKGEAIDLRGSLRVEASASPVERTLQEDDVRLAFSISGDLSSVNLAGRSIASAPAFIASPAGKATAVGGLALVLFGGYVVVRHRSQASAFPLVRGRSRDAAAVLRAEERAASWRMRGLSRWVALIALAYYGRLVASVAAPENARHRAERAECLLKLGRSREALADLHIAVASMPHDEFVRFDLSRALAMEGRLGEARAELAHALRLNPSLRAIADRDSVLGAIVPAAV